MPRTLDARRRLSLATLAILVAVWGCGRDTIAGPGPAAREPPLHLAPSPPPPTLTGEILTAASPAAIRQRGNCQTDNSVTITFVAHGPAAGPYTGTFVEAGRFRLTFGGTPRVTTGGAFDAALTIFSPTGLVVGTKSSPDFGLFFVFVCQPTGTVTFLPFLQAVGIGLLNYSATIHAAGRSFRDTGLANTGFLIVGNAIALAENFTSSQLATTPIGGSGDPDDEDED
jgi:hypothetical protein